jgi:hypothetical protein
MSDGEEKGHSEVGTKITGTEAREISRATNPCAPLKREAYRPCACGGGRAHPGLAD